MERIHFNLPFYLTVNERYKKFKGFLLSVGDRLALLLRNLDYSYPDNKDIIYERVEDKEVVQYLVDASNLFAFVKKNFSEFPLPKNIYEKIVLGIGEEEDLHRALVYELAIAHYYTRDEVFEGFTPEVIRKYLNGEDCVYDIVFSRCYRDQYPFHTSVDYVISLCDIRKEPKYDSEKEVYWFPCNEDINNSLESLDETQAKEANDRTIIRFLNKGKELNTLVPGK